MVLSAFGHSDVDLIGISSSQGTHPDENHKEVNGSLQPTAEKCGDFTEENAGDMLW